MKIVYFYLDPATSRASPLSLHDALPISGAAGLGRAGPLTRVQLRRVEYRRVLVAVPPLAVGERIDAEMKEEGELVALPGELRGGRMGPDAWLDLFHHRPRQGAGGRPREIAS